MITERREGSQVHIAAVSNHFLPVFFCCFIQRAFHQAEIGCIHVGTDIKFVVVMVNIIHQAHSTRMKNFELSLRVGCIQKAVFALLLAQFGINDNVFL